ncbi:hypothetical protein I7I48_00534 [Histoplasma ohiense]|nr:hypothetical protein I7I48_00534 [Histoplasma ohiense (nom. inval.)]
MKILSPENVCPTLRHFVNDEYPPTAILLQYIPNMKELKWTEYDERRIQNFVGGLNAIHYALVFHDDLHPRDMMVVDGNPEMIIWLDFDRARTFNGHLSERQKELIAFDKELVAEMADFMKHDFDKGQFDKTRQYYR